MRTLQLVVITFHVLAASAWLGSMAFLAFVLVPELRQRPEPLRRELLAATGTRLRKLCWWLFGFLSLTGLLQLHLRGFRAADLLGTLWEGPAGSAFAGKMGLFGVVVGLAAWHDFRIGPLAVATAADGQASERARKQASLAGRAIFLLGLLVVFSAVVFSRGGFR